MLDEFGEAGQQKLLDAKVLVIGAGGLGSAVITYLAAAGVGTIGVADHDRVELSNLARQILHETGDIGRLKVDSASDRVAELNPDVKIETHALNVSRETAQKLICGYDVVADGCDNFATRFAVNDVCVTLAKPLVSAAIAGWQGQVMTVLPGGPTYRDLVHPDAPEANTCRDSGVVGPLAGIIGSMQALEVIRVILGRPALAGKVAIYNGITAQQRISLLTSPLGEVKITEGNFG